METNETNQMASIIMCITCGCQYGVYWGNSCRKKRAGYLSKYCVRHDFHGYRIYIKTKIKRTIIKFMKSLLHFTCRRLLFWVKTRPTTYVTLMIQLKISYSVGKSKQSELLHFSTRTFIVLQNQTQSYIFPILPQSFSWYAVLATKFNRKGREKKHEEVFEQIAQLCCIFRFSYHFYFHNSSSWASKRCNFQRDSF
ncbi:conserved hypothetical protein [Bacillus altitudinis]|uniref:Uncharacterized protein n=1 Tax=Bacillus altitudinis TaxID=293387 RepID=A0A653Q2S4_BACAB|nr:conserved hypothetical protein [Bacillus altitudinis]VXB36348.1 conserved hypothetical protein [Bacillus altitudinis]